MMAQNALNRAKLMKVKTALVPTADYELVDVPTAERWLDEAGTNRNQRPHHVARLAAANTRGDWLPTSQGLGFDEDGKLFEGQHRLEMIVASNKPALLLVCRNLPRRAQLVTDIGVKRTAHDQVALREGWTVTAVHMAIAKSMIGSVGGIGDTERRAIVTDMQLLDRFYIKHHKAIEWVVAQFHRETVKGVTVAPMMAPVARARRAYLDGRQIERLSQMDTDTELFPLPNEKVVGE